MTSLQGVSTSETAIITALSAVFLAALKLTATILRRSVNGAKAPFHGARIDFGSYRIVVSRPQQSGSTQPETMKCAADQPSTFMGARDLKDASSSSSAKERPLRASLAPVSRKSKFVNDND